MANLKKNFIYNTILTISGYIFPLLTFPYVTRVLGVESLGIANFALSIIDYFILFSTFGITVVGLREISQCGDDKIKLSSTFSRLVSIHIVTSFFVSLIYICAIYIVPELKDHQELYWTGLSKIIFNIFLVEWLYRGLQEFKYITLRTILTRFLYVIAIFILVRNRSDYDLFILITVGQVVINAIINWIHSRSSVSFRFTLNGIKPLLFPLGSWGVNMILISFYTTFNVIYLGFASSVIDVGNYTTATKMYAIVLAMLQAYNGVFIPYLNSLYAKGDMANYILIIGKSFKIVSTLTIPLVLFAFLYAHQIIFIIAGPEFGGAVIPFRIILFEIIVVGISQITNSQILLPSKKDKEILMATLLGAVSMIVTLVAFVPSHGAIAAASALLISHSLESLVLLYYAKRSMNFRFPVKDYLVSIIVSLPFIIISMPLNHYIKGNVFQLLLGGIICMSFYLWIEIIILKNEIMISFIQNLKNKLHVP